MRLRPPVSAVPDPTTSPRRRWALTTATVCVGLTVAGCSSSTESEDGGGLGGGNLGGPPR
jgi:hypothetical protein